MIARLCIVVPAVAAFVWSVPSYAEKVQYVSPTGSGTTCSTAQPCADIPTALGLGGADVPGVSVRVLCLGGSALATEGFGANHGNETLDVDCPQGFIPSLQFASSATNITARLRHVGFRHDPNFGIMFQFSGSGTLILEDCVFTDASAAALDIEPSGPLNLVISNSRVSNGSTVAIILKPTAGGSINATFDHVTVTGNGGGGIRIDTTNGPVTADVTDSVISNNVGNGLNASGGAGGPAMLSIHNSVIAKNGQAGVSAAGATGAAMIDSTLLDSNTAATSVASGAHILTYGNNRIVGAPGSGFTGPASLQ